MNTRKVEIRNSLYDSIDVYQIAASPVSLWHRYDRSSYTQRKQCCGILVEQKGTYLRFYTVADNQIPPKPDSLAIVVVVFGCPQLYVVSRQKLTLKEHQLWRHIVRMP